MQVRSHAEPATASPVRIRSLQQHDLDAADRVMRLAFGTFIGLPEPAAFLGDASYVRGRWRADPSRAFAADIDGDVVGSNFANRWGSVGFFGPLTVRPDLWNRGIAKQLMEPVMHCFERWGTRHIGLFTFAQSPKHVGLYQRFGFFARFLTAIMAKPVAAATQPPHCARFSDVRDDERDAVVAACRDATDAIYDGLDVGADVRDVARLQLGDTVLVWNGARVAALAICHHGPGSEGGSGTCYVKFAGVRPSATAAHDFVRLLDACEAFAAEKRLARIVAGVNTACHAAYATMLERGFRTEIQGVAMHKPNEPAYHRPDVFALDDWR